MGCRLRRFYNVRLWGSWERYTLAVAVAAPPVLFNGVCGLFRVSGEVVMPYLSYFLL